jgi:acetylornithine/succinyldiaminopimelate/putrescine aminotransferase
MRQPARRDRDRTRDRTLPSEWIPGRELATSSGAVLVFDEIKTGFRLRTGGYRIRRSGADLAAFGKAMANGYPLLRSLAIAT